MISLDQEEKFTLNSGPESQATAAVCVYWYTCLSLVCYLENICVRYVVDKYISQILFVWPDFSSGFEKIVL